MRDQNQEQCSCLESDCSTCTNISTHYADVGTSIALSPYAIVGNVETACSGNPVISLCKKPGNPCCCGCEITLTQTLAIKIPITYGTIADVGETMVTCKNPLNE